MIKFLIRHEIRPHMHYSLFLVFSVLATIMTGCEPTPLPVDLDLVDQSFVTGQPCQAPCWYGIEPDQTSETEAFVILKDLPFVDQERIQGPESVNIFTYPNASEITFGCASPIGSNCGIIVSEQNIVKYMIFFIKYPLPLHTVIDLLGEPDYLFFVPHTPDGVGCDVSFNWPEKRISVISVERSQKTCRNLSAGKGLDPDLQITDVSYESEEIASKNYCDHLNCISWPGYLGE